ncbi:MAG: hypothetical protein GDA56_28730 [Hormoscilla sp. GM7CHS1pb]|nr:hypothetical protein [Hormoscilla sp. GM7CHS1pb]
MKTDFQIDLYLHDNDSFNGISEEVKWQFEQQKSVKVILMKEETLPTQDLIGQLLNEPLKVDMFLPLKREDIYD